jgi:hypothetical protein
MIVNMAAINSIMLGNQTNISQYAAHQQKNTLHILFWVINYCPKFAERLPSGIGESIVIIVFLALFNSIIQNYKKLQI